MERSNVSRMCKSYSCKCGIGKKMASTSPLREAQNELLHLCLPATHRISVTSTCVLQIRRELADDLPQLALHIIGPFCEDRRGRFIVRDGAGERAGIDSDHAGGRFRMRGLRDNVFLDFLVNLRRGVHEGGHHRCGLVVRDISELWIKMDQGSGGTADDGAVGVGATGGLDAVLKAFSVEVAWEDSVFERPVRFSSIGGEDRRQVGHLRSRAFRT